jgi:signal peptidase
VRALARLALAVPACMTLASLAPVLFGWHSYVVLSASMAPSLRVGDVVVAAPATAADLAPGRIAVFAEPGRPGRTLVHRVQRHLPDGSLITKGDANPAADSTPVPASAVRGEARLRLPLIALPAYWWQTRAWTPAAASFFLVLALIKIGYPTEPPAASWRGIHRRRRHRAGKAPANSGRGRTRRDGAELLPDPGPVGLSQQRSAVTFRECRPVSHRWRSSR